MRGDGQDRLAKGGHVQGNPAQIWGEQGAEGARAAPLAAKAAHNTLTCLPSLSLLNGHSAIKRPITIDILVPGSRELILLGDWATGRLALEKVASVTSWRLMDRASVVGAWVVGDG